MAEIEIIWTETAQEDLKKIYEFISGYSPDSAKKIIRQILMKPKELISGFENMGAFDEINPKYRRLIVGNYKILYSSNQNIVYINAIFDCRQNPKLLKKM